MGMEQKIERTEQYAHFAASQVPIRPKKVIYNERGITGIDRIMGIIVKMCGIFNNISTLNRGTNS